jgi:hypothetical protein
MLDELRQHGDVRAHLPHWLASHFYLARYDPQPPFGSSQHLVLLVVARQGKELQVHCVSCMRWQAQFSRNATQVLLEPVFKEPMAFVPSRFEEFTMDRHSVHGKEPASNGSELEQLLLEGKSMEETVLIKLLPSE